MPVCAEEDVEFTEAVIEAVRRVGRVCDNLTWIAEESDTLWDEESGQVGDSVRSDCSVQVEKVLHTEVAAELLVPSGHGRSDCREAGPGEGKGFAGAVFSGFFEDLRFCELGGDVAVHEANRQPGVDAARLCEQAVVRRPLVTQEAPEVVALRKLRVANRG